MITVHVIIVNYNSGPWLGRALASVRLCRNEVDVRVSVVDNASSDDSVACAQANLAEDSWAERNIEWLLNPSNLGFAAANNQVLHHLERDYVLLMNPDCELTPGTFSKLLMAFDAFPGCGLASGRILNEDGTLQATSRRRFPTPWSALVRMLQLHKVFPNHPAFANFDYGGEVSPNESIQSVEAISGAFMMAKREAVEHVGLLDEAYFMHCEDLDWCKRFQLSGWQVCFVPSVEVIHAKGVSSRSRPVRVLWTLHTGMNRFFDKFYRQSVAWPIRVMVKIGIVVSFLGRAGVSILRTLIERVRS